MTFFAHLVDWIDKTFTAYFFYSTLKFIVIPILLVAIIYFSLLIIISRYRVDQNDIKKEEVGARIDLFLTDLLFSNYSHSEINKKIENFKKEEIYKCKWCNYLLLNKLIHIKQNVKDVDKNLTLIIYKRFGLHKYSKKMIKRKQWYFKSIGFFHYQSLDYKIKKAQIKPYLSSKNKFLKSNALIAMIALSDEKFEILNNYQDRISNADEIKILDLIYQKKVAIPETIDNWFLNPNPSVIILAIKLIIRYRENIALDRLHYLLSFPDKQVRKETIVAIRELVIFDANAILMAHYHKELDPRNKISILKTFEVIGNETTKDFLIDLLFDEKNFEIKFHLISSINKIDKLFLKNLKIGNSYEEQMINKIVLHINNPYLN